MKKVKRFSDQSYWGRPLPGFGDSNARLLIVGLAPAAHGGNRTGRMFTGDRSGDWLYASLFKAGFASQPTSESIDDGLELRDCYITAAVRCAPPQNKPSPRESETCRMYLLDEIRLLRNIEVVVGLGRIGFETALKAFKELGMIEGRERMKFSHGAVYEREPVCFIASYHPSQQNTFTGRLTREMFDRIFSRVNSRMARANTGSKTPRSPVYGH